MLHSNTVRGQDGQIGEALEIQMVLQVLLFVVCVQSAPVAAPAHAVDHQMVQGTAMGNGLLC